MNEHHTLELRTRSIGPWPMHTYVFVCPTTRRSVLIDPGAEPATLMELLDGTTPEAILLTHTHADHIGVLDEMRERLKVPLLAHPGHGPFFRLGDLRGSINDFLNRDFGAFSGDATWDMQAS